VDGDRGRILEPVDALDYSAVLDAGDVQTVVLGAVDDIEAIALGEDAPRRAEIRPLGDELAALIEHLDALVAAIADVEPSLRVDGDAVRLVELSRLGSLPPHQVTNLPSFEYLTTRVLVLSPSAMKMSPFFAITRSATPLNASRDSLSPATPLRPSVISSVPSALNSKTWWSPRSVTQTCPARSVRRKCVVLNIFWPQARRKRPSLSNAMIGIAGLRWKT